jgi:3-hydroxyacyl-[acyl-carrier-protein] dehydratase
MNKASEPLVSSVLPRYDVLVLVYLVVTIAIHIQSYTFSRPQLSMTIYLSHTTISNTQNEEFFNGHFPDRPIMPGVLQVEALAQLAGIISLQMEGASPGAVFFFAGVNGVKWKKPVVPGDTLVMEVEILKWNPKFGLCKASGKSYVNGQVVVEVAEMTFALAK